MNKYMDKNHNIEIWINLSNKVSFCSNLLSFSTNTSTATFLRLLFDPVLLPPLGYQLTTKSQSTLDPLLKSE